MAEKPQAASSPQSSPAEAPTEDRRRRLALRRLIDEMLDEIRAAANAENWTTEAREQAELDLARIMEQVRREAVHGAKTDKKARKAK
jgi:hypothetical protein